MIENASMLQPISLFLQIVTALSSVAIAFLAYRGLTLWKDQNLKTTQHDLALEILILNETAHDLIYWANHPQPLPLDWDLSDGPTSDSLLDTRILRLREVCNELQTKVNVAEIFFNQSLRPELIWPLPWYAYLVQKRKSMTSLQRQYPTKNKSDFNEADWNKYNQVKDLYEQLISSHMDDASTAEIDEKHNFVRDKIKPYLLHSQAFGFDGRRY